MYENVNLISAETARQRIKDVYVRSRDKEMERIMDCILNCINAGKEFYATRIHYNSTVDKLLELGYVLSSTETLESYLENKPHKECVVITEIDQIIISWS